MAQRSTLRASDEDRERVAERLRRAATEGRILSDELEDRMATALRAKTYGELDAVVADLPRNRKVPAKRSRTREIVQTHPIASVAIAAVMTVVMAVVVAVIVASLVVFWTLWMLVGWVFLARRGALRHRHHRRQRYDSRAVNSRPVAGSFTPWL